MSQTLLRSRFLVAPKMHSCCSTPKNQEQPSDYAKGKSYNNSADLGLVLCPQQSCKNKSHK